MTAKVLLVDDEGSVRFAVGDYLERHGYEIAEAEDGVTAREEQRRFAPDAIVVDYRLPDCDALDLIPDFKSVAPDVVIIVLTGHASIDLAVSAVKLGAEHFMTKPVELAGLETILQRSLSNQRTRKRDVASQAQRAAHPRDPFIGTSAAIAELREQARRVAGSTRPVLIQGETGAGKGVLARWIHSAGARAEDPFVDLNCAGLTRELLESELFGHEKGAFTGAVSMKPGLLEIADRGTVFLDEIGDMDPALQAKVLKVVEEQQFRRVGDVRDRRVDVRLIAATHRDLAAMAREEKFRSDLYFRITTLRIVMPPLRSRVEDIPLLAEAFVRELARDIGRPRVRLSAGAIDRMRCHSWPGNVRELRNVIERALLLGDGNEIAADDLHFDDDGSARRAASASDVLADVEREHILRILEQENGHVDRAAQRLGVPRSSLYQRLKKYGR